MLFNDDAEDIQSPTEYFYIKIVRFTLKLINSWPSKEIGEYESKFKSIALSIFLTILSFAHLFGGILYLGLRRQNLAFLDVGYGYITTFMNFVITSRLLTLTFSTKYRNLAVTFLTQIHLYYFKDRSKYAMKTHRRVQFISHKFTILLAAQTLAGVVLFNVIPIYNYFSSGCYKYDIPRNLTYDISTYVLYPFESYTNNKTYILICIFNCVSSTLAAIWFCMFDLFLSLFVFHTWGHFKILIHNLDCFPRPMNRSSKGPIVCEKYTANELFIVALKLQECMNYHKLIVSFTKRMSDVFGTMLFVYYMFYQVSGCLLLLECSQMTTGALLRYLPMSIILYQQLIQLSVIFELIGTTSEKLKHHVYCLPWELMDVSNRKTVLIFLMNVQKPIHVKALGLANVGLTSMVTILKTSLSYFTFLYSM